MKLLNWFKKTYQQYRDLCFLYDLSEYSVQDLKQNNFEIKIFHYRFSNDGYKLAKLEKHQTRRFSYLTDRVNCSPSMFYSKGGRTKVEVITPNNERYYGISDCSLEDSFCKRTGISIALAKLRKIHNYECNSNGEIIGISSYIKPCCENDGCTCG